MPADTTTTAPSAPQGATNHPALTPLHWWADCNEAVYGTERAAALAPLAAALNSSNPSAVIAAASGRIRNGYVSRAWSLAMTAVHGPTGTHPTQSAHPRVLAAMVQAANDLRAYLCV